MQAAASLETVAAAQECFQSVQDLACDVPHPWEFSLQEITSLIDAWANAASDVDVTEEFLYTVCCIRGSVCFDVNIRTSVAAGIISAIVSAMTLHGCISRIVASSGCSELSNLLDGKDVNADAIVSSGGLDAILTVMESHADDWTIQTDACASLARIAESVSPTGLQAMRDSRAIRLVHAARVLYNTRFECEHDDAVRALTLLDPESVPDSEAYPE